MKVSSKGEYALRALIVLAKRGREVTPVADIAREIHVPVPYLEQILLQLKLLGFLRSKRGAGGGYRLRKKPGEIMIGEVIRQLEGPLAPMSCVSATRYESCELEPGCLLQPLWAKVRDTVAEVLDRTSLEDLLERRV
jgi:Rrf2 family protein